MTEAIFARDTLVTFGAGIAALLLVFGTLAYALFTAPKFFKAWQEMVKASDAERQKQLTAITELTAMTSEVIRANTGAFQDSSKSTDNMAKALELLTAMYERTSTTLSEHDSRSQLMFIELSKISERTAACRTRSTDPR